MEKVANLAYKLTDIQCRDSVSNDTAMNLLFWIRENIIYREDSSVIPSPPGYTVHSRNPEGKKNIQAFMNSWEKLGRIPSHG